VVNREAVSLPETNVDTAETNGATVTTNGATVAATVATSGATVERIATRETASTAAAVFAAMDAPKGGPLPPAVKPCQPFGFEPH
jgi:hypothetical protein